VVLAAIIGSMAAAPTVIRRVYKDNYVKSMSVERDIQRERLREKSSDDSLEPAWKIIAFASKNSSRSTAWSTPRAGRILDSAAAARMTAATCSSKTHAIANRAAPRLIRLQQQLTYCRNTRRQRRHGAPHAVDSSRARGSIRVDVALRVRISPFTRGR